MVRPEPRRLPLELWGRAILAAVERRAGRSRVGRWAFEFLMFGLKQGWASLFGAVMLTLIVGTAIAWPAQAPIARYDFLVIAALAVQAAMLAFRLESLEEAKVILLFHVVGTVMEVFKTHVGAWQYPEASLLRIGGVPLFSGFMYASVGSYIARIWRIFDVHFTGYPPAWAPWALAVAIYANFFLDHWGLDLRWALFAAAGLVFWRTWFFYTPDHAERRMPMLVGTVLVAFFIWVAENLGTLSHAWLYPSQRHGWSLVGPAKIGSWMLLSLISFVLVSLVKRPEVERKPALQLRAASGQ